MCSSGLMFFISTVSLNKLIIMLIGIIICHMFTHLLYHKRIRDILQGARVFTYCFVAHFLILILTRINLQQTSPLSAALSHISCVVGTNFNAYMHLLTVLSNIYWVLRLPGTFSRLWRFFAMDFLQFFRFWSSQGQTLTLCSPFHRSIPRFLALKLIKNIKKQHVCIII